ncbi:hypothetical protein K0T92_10640 [Paenibacillus oenotherae]|uniref:Uncharacterized protein n=1 Tax=Paenibacillus oenotherae TaxID=1435645 RepID=A0ABS7D5I3_9BACL|nr:hypothetical protein [Paenibacillus oenotherae]MBW7475205.1 hypothetical protein [Paenibacillus oenotherae]
MISGTHHTLNEFIEGFSSKEVDSSAIVIMEGGAGLSIPVNPNVILARMTQIRQYLKRSRLIVQLDPSLQNDIEFIRSMVNLGIHDLHFTLEFRNEELMNWIKEKKTTRDYYHILGKKKRNFLFRRNANAPEPGNNEEEPPIVPPAPVESLTRPAPASNQRQPGRTQTSGSRSSASPAPERLRDNDNNEPSLPIPETSSNSSSPRRAATGNHLPLIIGISGVGGEEDVGAAAFLIAGGLVDLGWRPLVCGDDRPEISSLEQVALDGEKDDPAAKMFEYEGVTFFRRGCSWDISELMTSEFSHIILWLDIHQERKGMSGLELWWNAQVPILVGNGAMWKYELLKEKLSTLNHYERKRCLLLLENGHQEVLNKLKKDFQEVQASLIPVHNDPLYPDKAAVEWVMGLLAVNKKIFRKPVILWIVVGSVLFITLILIAIGLSIVPESGN